MREAIQAARLNRVAVVEGKTIIGEGASELVHVGQAVMAFKGKVEYFVNNVFNYSTLAECCKTAAFDGINRLGSNFHLT